MRCPLHSNIVVALPDVASDNIHQSYKTISQYNIEYLGWNAINKFAEKFRAWLETLRFLTLTFSSKYLYRNFSSRSQIHLILGNVVQVSGHKVTNKPIPKLTQASRERHCTFCHFHFLSRDRRNKLFTKINIAFYDTFTFYKEIKVVLSFSTKNCHIALALHYWRHSNFCSLARPHYQSFEIGKATLIGFGW